MADTVTSKTVEDYAKSPYITVHLTGICDGTNETGVVKIDKSTIGVAQDNAEPAALDLIAVDWNNQGYSYIKLFWDRTAAETIVVLPGTSGGSREFRKNRSEGGLLDARGAGATGDIKLTSVGGAANATYDITLVFAKAND